MAVMNTSKNVHELQPQRDNYICGCRIFLLIECKKSFLAATHDFAT